MMEYVQLAADTVPDQMKNSITATTTAINAVKAAWDSWVWIVPVITTVVTQLSALVSGVNSIPGLKWIAGNYGHSTNAKG